MKISKKQWLEKQRIGYASVNKNGQKCILTMDQKTGATVLQPVEIAPDPSPEQLMEWLDDNGCEAVDGCWVEHDAICPHGSPSWFLEMGLI